MILLFLQQPQARAGDQRDQPRPPNGGIAHERDRRHHAPASKGRVGGEIPHRPDDNRPFVPGRFEVMVVHDVGMLAVHLLLQLPDFFHREAAARSKVPVVAEVIDCERHEDKRGDAQVDREHESDRISGDRASVRLSQAPAAEEVFVQRRTQLDEKDQRQPRCGVHADPLGGAGKAHADTRKQQRQKLFPEFDPEQIHAVIADHEQVHHKDKEHRVAVHRGDARLGEVHGIKCQQQHAKQGRGALAAQLPDEQVNVTEFRYRAPDLERIPT